MAWDELSAPWQAAFSQAWEAYCAGSMPIGCAIADRDDGILLTGRNRMRESESDSGLLHGNHLAHAEMNALVHFSPGELTARECVLYSTMEPCPMCTGAIRMIGVGAVHYAARDPVAGSIHLLDATPFMRRNGISVTGPGTSPMETFSSALVIASYLEHFMGTDLPVRMMSEFQRLVPEAVALGQRLDETGTLSRFRAGDYLVDEVYNAVLGDPGLSIAGS